MEKSIQLTVGVIGSYLPSPWVVDFEGGGAGGLGELGNWGTGKLRNWLPREGSLVR